MSEASLHRKAFVDEPGLVGAQWWQDSVVDPVGRRTAIAGLLVVGGVLGVAALGIETMGSREERRRSLELQRQLGWDFGAATKPLVFDGETREGYDSSRLVRMVTELAPRAPAHLPFYVPTLFESLNATPKEVLDGEAPSGYLPAALRPIFTPAMRDAFERGQASGAALSSAAGTALVVDLEGPAAVAFAAGAATYFDPIFLFDNWPHPRGVVPAHRALAAAAYYQPLLARAHESASPAAPPMFVLDRERLDPYRDDTLAFDNRWIARMPSAGALRSLGVQRIVYVYPDAVRAAARAVPPELDDLNEDFVAYAQAGIAIAALGVGKVSSDVESPTLGEEPYAPVPRPTAFSAGSSGHAPHDFGSVPVEVSLLGGALLGVRWSQESGWSRGGWGRGGG